MQPQLPQFSIQSITKSMMRVSLLNLSPKLRSHSIKLTVRLFFFPTCQLHYYSNFLKEKKKELLHKPRCV